MSSLILPVSPVLSTAEEISTVIILRPGRPENLGSISGADVDSSFRHCIETDTERCPTSYPVGTGGSLSRARRPGSYSDHPNTSGA
jgi:hypothetical protein